MPALVSTSSRVAETLRQELTGDVKFYKKYLYFFELVIPAQASRFGTPIRTVFPIMLNPQEYEVSAPYALSLTPTVGGGVVAERTGVVVRDIRIAGVSGLAPRAQIGLLPLQNLVRTDVTTTPIRGPAPLAQLAEYSGPRRFQLLEDQIFNLYSDLVQNPETSADTKLIWHVIKDDTHWLVEPGHFKMSRSRTMYHYDILLHAIDGADARDIEFVPQRDAIGAVRSTIRDVRQTVQSGIDFVEGALLNVKDAIRDIDSAVRSVRNTIESVTQIVSDVTDVVDAATDFVRGAASHIDMPFAVAADALDKLDDLSAGLSDLVVAGTIDVPIAVFGEIASMRQGMSRLLTAKDRFQSKWSERERILELNRSAAFDSDEPIETFTTLAQANTLGTALGPGDAQKARARGDTRQTSRRARVATSATSRTIVRGDSIQDVARKFLGDPTRWREIVMLNDLQPPYLHEAGLPGTLRGGDRILIPSDAPAVVAANAAVHGASPDDDVFARTFGADFRLDPSTAAGGAGLFDLVVADDGLDYKRVEGLANLAQGVRSRVITPRGDDPLFPEVGFIPTIGSSMPAIEREVLEFEIAASVRADPRIAEVTAVDLSSSTQDAFRVRIEADAVAVETKTSLDVSVPVVALALAPPS